jgi:hypothetical protein
MSVLYFIYLILIFMEIGHNFARTSLLMRRLVVVMLTSSIRQCSFPFAVTRMVVVLWQIALHSYVSSCLAFFSRKYGTVWYHPASSKLWYSTALSFVNFQEKLTGTSFALCACEASFVRLAVWLALSALFAPTVGNAWIKPKMQNFQPRASQTDKIQQRMLHMSKWAS